jgi:hypothetical protein
MEGFEHLTAARLVSCAYLRTSWFNAPTLYYHFGIVIGSRGMASHTPKFAHQPPVRGIKGANMRWTVMDSSPSGPRRGALHWRHPCVEVLKIAEEPAARQGLSRFGMDQQQCYSQCGEGSLTNREVITT